jgi:serine/threonine protein kinase
MPMATRMSAAKQLLEALESLHKAGIVHRGE